MPRITAEVAGHPNLLVALDLIGWSEGTSTSPLTKDDGYDIIVHGISTPPGPFPRTFTDYSKHPNVRVTVNSKGLISTAAGRYQALKGTWDECVAKYSFKGRFTPEAQDMFAIKKITERGALEDVKAGRWSSFITKCNQEWASFAGSPYNQNPHTMESMLAKVAQLQAA